MGLRSLGEWVNFVNPQFQIATRDEPMSVQKGVVAAHTTLPVVGVPLTSSASVAGGLDAMLAIAQMPPGVPVACVAVNGARNAAILAARIIDV